MFLIESASAKHSSVARELKEVRELLNVLVSDRLPPRVRKELQSVVQLLRCYLRAAELEMRAVEEPLRSDLDVAGSRRGCSGASRSLRREREEILSELVPAMEARGHDTEVMKAMMRG